MKRKTLKDCLDVLNHMLWLYPEAEQEIDYLTKVFEEELNQPVTYEELEHGTR